MDDLESAIAPFSETYARFLPWVKALSALRTSIMNNRHVIPNYSERYRHGAHSAPLWNLLILFSLFFRSICPIKEMANKFNALCEWVRDVRHGEASATGFVESTVHEVVSKRFCKQQQMQWSKEGAHLLLQTRVRTLNGELGAIFKRWYPDMDLEVEEIPIAA
jgi:hypothetical protein